MSVAVAHSPSTIEPPIECMCPRCGSEVHGERFLKKGVAPSRETTFEDVTPGELIALVIVVGFVAWAALAMLTEPMHL